MYAHCDGGVNIEHAPGPSGHPFKLGEHRFVCQEVCSSCWLFGPVGPAIWNWPGVWHALHIQCIRPNVVKMSQCSYIGPFTLRRHTAHFWEAVWTRIEVPHDESGCFVSDGSLLSGSLQELVVSFCLANVQVRARPTIHRDDVVILRLITFDSAFYKSAQLCC